MPGPGIKTVLRDASGTVFFSEFAREAQHVAPVPVIGRIGGLRLIKNFFIVEHTGERSDVARYRQKLPLISEAIDDLREEIALIKTFRVGSLIRRQIFQNAFGRKRHEIIDLGSDDVGRRASCNPSENLADVACVGRVLENDLDLRMLYLPRRESFGNDADLFGRSPEAHLNFRGTLASRLDRRTAASQNKDC